jgi:hypothetical protein
MVSSTLRDSYHNHGCVLNEILTHKKKTRSVFRNEYHMDQCMNALDECYLKDLGYKGSMHTWTNGRHDENFIKERLDRAVANIEWTALFH